MEFQHMTRILLVDDVELFLELERTFLKRLGCQIVMTEALDGLTVALPEETHNFLLD